MGRKYTNITFKVHRLNETFAEASSRPRTREQVIYDFTQEEWDEDNVAPHMGVTVTFGKVGFKEQKLKEYIEKYFTRFEWIEKAAVVAVTDSANIGYGQVYRNEYGDVNLVDEYEGYENAFGNDVAVMISDDYSIRPTAEFYW